MEQAVIAFGEVIRELVGAQLHHTCCRVRKIWLGVGVMPIAVIVFHVLVVVVLVRVVGPVRHVVTVCGETKVRIQYQLLPVSLVL